MNNLTNSIIRGFGLTLGRKAANKVTNFKSVKSDKNYLTFWEGIKTILWFLPNFILSFFLNIVWDMFTKDFLSKNYHPNFPLITFWAVIFTIIIGYNYYNKKS